MTFEELSLKEIGVEIIDGDRGKNYPSIDEMQSEGFCLFLSANNVTVNGFVFNNAVFITKEKDEILHSGKMRRNDIVITTRGTVGNVAYYSAVIPFENMRINSGMLIVRSNNKIETEYLYYCLKSQWFQRKIKSIQSGSAQPQLPKKHFQEMTIPLPSRKIQMRIATICKCLDKKIANNNAINNNLQAQAQALFKAWFIDNADNSNWQIGVFSDFIDSLHSGDWGKDTPNGLFTQQVYCIRGADIPDIKNGNRGKMPIRYIQSKNLYSKKLGDCDLVVEISGGSPTQSTGRIAQIHKALIDRYGGDMVCTNFCKAITPKPNMSAFVYFYWQYLYSKGVLFSYENGTTGIKNLDISGFIETEQILIPPEHLIRKFQTICDHYFDEIAANGLESERLSVLRDTLLPKLMSGEIDVSDVKI